FGPFSRYCAAGHGKGGYRGCMVPRLAVDRVAVVACPRRHTWTAEVHCSGEGNFARVPWSKLETQDRVQSPGGRSLPVAAQGRFRDCTAGSLEPGPPRLP